MQTGGADVKRIAIESDFPPPNLKLPQRNWIESLAASKSVRGHYFTNSVLEDLLLLKSS